MFSFVAELTVERVPRVNPFCMASRQHATDGAGHGGGHGTGGLDLPGLGRASSVIDAAKRLSALASKGPLPSEEGTT